MTGGSSNGAGTSGGGRVGDNSSWGLVGMEAIAVVGEGSIRARG